MIKVFLYDEKGSYTGYKEMPKDYQLQSGETLIEPDTSLYDLRFDGTKWIGLTLEEYQQQHPVSPKQPSPEQVMLMQQQGQIMSLKESNKQLQKMVMNQQAQIMSLQKEGN